MLANCVKMIILSVITFISVPRIIYDCMSVTLSSLRTMFYDILREEQDTSAYPLTFADQLINAAQQRICNGRVINPLSKEEVRKWQLPFLFVDKFYANIQSTSLSVDVVAWATVLTVAKTDDFPTAGYLFIAGNIIPYTGKTTTTFTGCSNVLYWFEAGQEVSISFQLPTDYASVTNVIYNNNYKMEAQLYDDIFENLNQNKRRTGLYNDYNQIGRYNSGEYRRRPFYTIKDMQYLIIFNANRTNDMIRFRYEKQPPLLVAGSDVSIIPNDIYAKWTIPYLAVWEIFYNRWEEQRGWKIINFAIGQIREMYNYYNEASFEQISGWAYRVWKWRLNL